MSKGIIMQTTRHVTRREPDLWQKVKIKAVQKGITAQDAVTEALKLWLASP